MSITMEPESDKGGNFRPKNSIGMDGDCETALLRMRCLVLLDTALFVKVLMIHSNLSSNQVSEGGSNLAPSLCPIPWEAGAVSLTPPLIFLDWQGTALWLGA